MKRGSTILILLTLTLFVCVGGLMAQTNDAPPLPPARSPIDTFRELLALTPAERAKSLADRPAASRERLLEKLSEYEKLNPDDQALRLHATELRWWLLPMMRQPSTNQLAVLAFVPEQLRPLIKQRLELWNILPPTLQEELLDNEDIAQLFIQVQGRTEAQKKALLDKLTTQMPTERRPALEAGLQRWTAMSAEERRLTCERFDHYFELNARERQKVLGTLSEDERRKMEESLQAFGKLSREKRTLCVQSFEKFANMSVPERLQFLKNVERWEKMTPTQRQAWRNLVSRVPDFPPLPPGVGEPSSQPPPLPGSRGANLPATNRSRTQPAASIGGG